MIFSLFKKLNLQKWKMEGFILSVVIEKTELA